MRTRRWLLALLLGGVAIRVGLWLAYEPIDYDDTPTYFTMATHLASGDYSTYEGRRTPGYPALIALGGRSPHGVWALQMLAGLAISALLFAIALRLTGSPGFSMLVGMTYNLNLAQLFFEANLLSETASTLTVVAAVAGLLTVYGRVEHGQPVVPWLVFLGGLAGLATLVRPQFVFLPLVLGVLVGAFVAVRSGRRGVWRAVRDGGLVVATGLIVILPWTWFNHVRVGSFTLTTQFGVGLMAHSMPLLESAPDRYATLRDVYIRYRDAKIAATGHHFGVWDALPELRERTGLSFPELSRELQWMSLTVILQHPVRYAAGVAQAWVDFWLAPIAWRPDRLTPPWMGSALGVTWRWVEHPLVRLANGVFLVSLGAAMVSPWFRRRTRWGFEVTSIAVIVIGSSIVPALSFWGDNARYAIPVQALVIAVVLVEARAWLATREVAGLIVRAGAVPVPPAGHGRA